MTQSSASDSASEPLPTEKQERLGEAVARARKGDQKAFTELFACYHGPICTYLAHLVGNEDVGRDLAQETFIRAWKGLQKLQGELLFRPWLYAIATNVARSHLQRERLPRWLSWGEYTRGIGATQAAPHASEPGERLDEQEYIAEVLGALPPQCRTCLLLQHVGGFSQREIAAILGISEKSVSAYVSRGREQFRLIYQQLKGAPLS